MKIKNLLLLLVCAFVMSACTDGKDQKTSNSSDQQDNDTQADNQIPKTREDIVYDQLYASGTGQQIREQFTDLESIFVWAGPEGKQDLPYFPMTHYYSSSSDLTFVISAQDNSVVICDGKIDTKISFDSLGCTISPLYVEYFL